ncbi:hypothetical protein Fcan01_00138 [Folsomia candida]|uniref:Uncharacterized protein n=1 Tax=Folsomia candida TaxID=158441 RepID=A0A226F2Y0_FOLCA|nr:hypothetical protein Fcan01_00138 [Folsomia candida]
MVVQSWAYNHMYGSRTPSIHAHVLCIIQISVSILTITLKTYFSCGSTTLLPACVTTIKTVWSFGTFSADTNSSLPIADDFQNFYAFFTMIDMSSNIWTLLVEIFGQLLMLLGIFELLNGAKAFTTSLSADPLIHYKNLFKVSQKRSAQILYQWRELKLLSDSINAVTNGIVFVFWIVATSYVSGTFDQVTRYASWFDKWSNFHFVTIVGLVFGVAPKICEEVEKFREFILRGENENLFSLDERTRLLADLDRNPVGIGGSTKFVINNNFLANMLMTLLTLFVVVLQT